MALRDKNGKELKLRGPKQIPDPNWAEGQKTNFNFPEEVVKQEAPPTITVITEEKPPEPQPIIEIPVVVEPEPTPPEPIVEPEPIIEIPAPVIEEKVSIPAPKSQTNSQTWEEDDFYGGKLKFDNPNCSIYCLPFFNDAYGDKTIIQGKLVKEDDLYIVFETEQLIPENSIIFPTNRSKRWWKVYKTGPHKDKFAILGLPTQENPSFVD